MSRALFKSALFLLTLSSALLFTLPAHASFNANNLMDDSIFDNSGTMTASGIDNWLNTNFGSASCISTSHGFTAPEPIGYSSTGPTATGGFSYGSDVSAGTIIYDAAKVYGLNPQVILTTLDKEESLVTGSGTSSNPGCSTWRYTSAMGYLCTDTVSSHNYSGFELYSINGVPVNSVTGTCVQSDHVAGFSRQVLVAAWQLKYSEQRSEGSVNWDVQLNDFPHSGNIWNNSDDPLSCYRYLMTQGNRARANSTNTNPCPTSTSPPANSVNYYDGTTTIDGTGIHLDTGATASLYDYTPHFPGNQSFVNIFTGWFGNTVGPGYDYVTATNPTAQILPNDVQSVQIQIRNRSGLTWYSDGNVPSGKQPLRLMLMGYANSPFANTSDPAWLGTSNQIKMQETSVADGQLATFIFTLKGPLQQINTYQMQFTPVLDGAKIFPYIGVNWTVNTPAPIFSYNVTASSGITGNLPTNYPDPVTYTIQNTGNIVWYNEATKPTGAYSLRMLTANSFYHGSAFYDYGSWLATNQIGMSTTKVLPGGSASFSFNLKTPAVNGTYGDSFGLVLDGAAIYPDTSQMHFSTVVSDYTFTVTSNNLPTTLLAGQKYSGKIILHNSGAATWYSDGNTPVNTHAIRLMMAGYKHNLLADLSDTSWLGNGNQIKMMTTSVASGADGEFDFNFVAPYDLPSFNNDFRLVLDGVYIVPTSVQNNISIPAKTYSYSVAPNGIGPTNTMSPGQIIASKLFIKNNTNFVWYSDSAKPTSLVAGAFRVVMNFPWYRSSVFADSADPSWIGNGSQIKMITSEVDPGGIGEFDFNWKAPLLVGYYREHFSLALDGYSVLPDIGMEIDVTVR